LVSMMLVNNETGVIQDVASLAKIAKQHGALVHTDAVQALGKIPLNFNELGVDAMTLSSHKIYGPQGAGALVLDKRVDIQPLLHGGGQERGLRSGTENVAAIVGFGKACELISARLHSNQMHCRQLRDRLEQGLTAMGATIFGQGAERVNNTSFFAFEGIEGETMVVALDNAGFAVASGSACSSDSTEPSHVLMAMGVASDLARGAVRISLSAQNTMAQIDEFLMVLQQQQQRLKTLAGVAMM
jgi:cysteine desulfurase